MEMINFYLNSKWSADEHPGQMGQGTEGQVKYIQCFTPGLPGQNHLQVLAQEGWEPSWDKMMILVLSV